MEHLLHLTAKHFVKSITPLSCNTGDTSEGASDDDCDNNSNNNLNSGDSLGKAIALVKQVRIPLLY